MITSDTHTTDVWIIKQSCLYVHLEILNILELITKYNETEF